MQAYELAAGFAVTHDVLSRQECIDIANALGAESVARTRAGSRHVLSHPAVAEVAASPALLNMAESYLGGTAFPFRATLFFKSRAANWLVVWHQDTALPLRSRFDAPGWGPWSVKAGILYAHAPAAALSQVVALRLHLDSSTEANGPLRVIPNSHTAGVLTDQAITELVRASEPVSCIAGPGSVVAMRPLIVHSSSKSTSSDPRRVLHIEYAATLTPGHGATLAVA